MKQDQAPIDQVSPAVVPDQAHQSRRRRNASTTRGLRKPELKLTSMIDVVFLLLIFFVVTANVTIDEGTLQARMPGNSKPDLTQLPPVPVLVDIRSSDDGLTYSMKVDGVGVQGASELSAYMTNRVATGQMASDDLVKITPQGVVRWQHVVNVYNACVTAKLEQVTFAY